MRSPEPSPAAGPLNSPFGVSGPGSYTGSSGSFLPGARLLVRGFAPKLQSTAARGGSFRSKLPRLVSKPDFWCKAPEGLSPPPRKENPSRTISTTTGAREEIPLSRDPSGLRSFLTRRTSRATGLLPPFPPPACARPVPALFHPAHRRAEHRDERRREEYGKSPSHASPSLRGVHFGTSVAEALTPNEIPRLVKGDVNWRPPRCPVTAPHPDADSRRR